jgi:hypothetical protein
VAVKMIADRPRRNRKKIQNKRHRQKYWWNATDNDRVLHLASCAHCYVWVMRQVEATRVRHPAGRNWYGYGNSLVHVNYGKVGEEF